MKRYVKSSYIASYTFSNYSDLKSQYDSYIRSILPNFTYVDADGNTASMTVTGIRGSCWFYLTCPAFMYDQDGNLVDFDIVLELDGSPEYVADRVGWGAHGYLRTSKDSVIFHGSRSVNHYDYPDLTLQNIFDYITPELLEENVRSILDEAYAYREKFEKKKSQRSKRTKLGGPTYVTYKYGNDENWLDQFQRAYDKALKRLGMEADADSYGVTLYYEDDPDYSATIENDEFENAFMDFWQSSRSVSEFNKNIEQYISMHF